MKTSIGNLLHLGNTGQELSVGGHYRRGFTLVELLVMVVVLGLLVLVVAPTLAGTKRDSWRVQCQSNLKQLNLGFQLFTQDHGDMFPPACYAVSASGRALTWDAYLHRYFGDTNSDSAWTLGVMYVGSAPVCERAALCPADATLPKINWMHFNGDPTEPLRFAPRTYEMISSGRSYAVDIQVNPLNGKYPLPDLNQPNRYGVGIYWQTTSGPVDWDARGYRTPVVKDPAGTVLLCEDASSQGCLASQWPSCCLGPYASAGGSWSSVYQIDAAAPTDSTHLFASGYSEGQLLYPAHGNRFNYLFHDGHVAPLQIEQTIGTGTLMAPKGEWTVTPGD